MQHLNSIKYMQAETLPGEVIYLIDKSDVLAGPPNKKPALDRDQELRDKHITTREIEAGPPDVGDDAWLPS